MSDHIDAALMAYGHRPPPIPAPRYLVSIPPLPLININDTKRAHFRVTGPKKAALREAASHVACGIPFMTMARVICFVTREVNGPKEKWDPANWYPSAKACVDGFTDAGLWPDDSILHVIGPDMRGVAGHKEKPYGRLVFRIIDLSAETGGGVDG